VNRRETVDAAWTAWWRHNSFRLAVIYLPFMIVCLVFAYLYITKDTDPHPILGPYSDVEVLNEDDTLRLGETVMIRAEFCTSAVAEVHTDVFIRKLGSSGETREPVKFIGFDTHREVACGPINLSIPISRSLGAGEYNIYGVDTVIGSGETKIWVSEDFTVE
jgi:hypothetical protein